MKLCYSWLRELADFNWDAQELADRLSLTGTESKVVGKLFPDFSGVVVGKIESAESIEGSQKLTICRVDTGSATLTSLCGAPNVRTGMKVAFAMPGAVLPGGESVAAVEKMGYKSEGMICSEAELGLSDDHAGIVEIDKKLKIGTNLREALELDDWLIEFDLTPNRPDCLSAIGIAREIAAMNGTKLNIPKATLKEAAEPASGEVSIEIDSADLCPRYMARVIRNVEIGPSPWWIKKKLYSAGIRSINNVVDITNLVLMETGHPLHAFDYDLFTAPGVVVRSARKDEKFTTLDGVERTLDPGTVLITDSNKAVALGGIMGGLESEVNEKTKRVLLESAYFNPKAIRVASKRLGLSTESQVRFEKGADPNCVPVACDRAAALIQEYANGTVLAGRVDCYPNVIEPVKIELRPTRVNQILDTDMSSPEMIDILTSLEFGVQPGKQLVVDVPTFRPDVTREIDLIEEIARIHGLDKIRTSNDATGSLLTSERLEDRFVGRLKEFLVSQGYGEALTYTLIDPKKDKIVSGLDNHVKVLNPVSVELAVMRQNFVHSFLNIAAYNLNRKKSDLLFFEVGTVFIPVEGRLLPDEKSRLALLACGSESVTRWDRPRENYDFFTLKGLLEVMAEGLGFGALTLKQANHPYFAKGKSFDVCFGETDCGVFGAVAQTVLKLYDIELPAYFAELRVESMLDIFMKDHVASQVPRFPSSVRDIALIVDPAVKAADLRADILANGRGLVEKVELFDVYTGKQIPQNKKSLAYSIEYRSMEKTLTDQEIDDVHAAIVDSLGRKFQAELRT